MSARLSNPLSVSLGTAGGGGGGAVGCREEEPKQNRAKREESLRDRGREGGGGPLSPLFRKGGILERRASHKEQFPDLDSTLKRKDTYI